MSGGVIVQVLGELSNKTDVCHKFSQTFFLAEQPEGYYVLNDIFRFLKEDIDATAGNSDWDGIVEEAATPVFNYQDKSVPVAEKPASKPHPAGEKPAAKPIPAEKQPAKVPPKQAPAVPKPAAPATAPVSAKPVPAPVAVPAAAPAENEEAKKPLSPVKQTAPVPQEKAVPKPAPVPSGSAEKPKPVPANPAAEKPAAAQEVKPAPRAQSPSKRPAAPFSWSKVVASPSDTPQSVSAAPSQPASRQASQKPPAPTAQPPKPQPQKIPAAPVPKKEDPAVASDGFQDVPSRHRNDRRSTEEKEKATIYIRSVGENVEKRALQEAFESMGQVLHVDMPPGKQIAFVTFKNAESAQQAIGKTFMVNGSELLAEERKKPGFQGAGKKGPFNAAGFKGNNRGGEEDAV
ncbi:hypothetical protein HDV03_000667 [Kappamyces sp. JEL0829]|nr:hypothetical protein HDV03_000667 [Kappamyces sp. JEL0829]